MRRGASVDRSSDTLVAVTRLSAIFEALRAADRKALMPFICGAHPGPGDTARLLPALARAGASVVEVGYPFSDPIADGPVIAAAMHDALAAGATPAAVHAEIAAARAAGATIGVVSMVSMSIVARIGADRFLHDAREAGVDGLIIPDLPLEESDDMARRARDARLTLTLLVGPATDDARAAKIAGLCTGFVYVVARAGTTGDTGGPALDAGALAGRIGVLRKATALPLAVGFGISTPGHVHAVVHEAGADAAIVGSALVRTLCEAAAAKRDLIAEAERFVHDLAAGLDR